MGSYNHNFTEFLIACHVPNSCFPSGSDGKESTCNAGERGLIPGSGRSLWEGNGNPLQYSCLESPMDREAWRAIVHGAANSWTHLKQRSNGARMCQTQSFESVRQYCWMTVGAQWIAAWCKSDNLELLSRCFLLLTPAGRSWQVILGGKCLDSRDKEAHYPPVVWCGLRWKNIDLVSSYEHPQGNMQRSPVPFSALYSLLHQGPFCQLRL